MKPAYEIWSPLHGWVDLHDRPRGQDENGCLILSDRKIGPLAWRRKAEVHCLTLDSIQAIRDSFAFVALRYCTGIESRLSTKPRLTAADIVWLRDMKIGLGD
jgi:hypothetical protein